MYHPVRKKMPNLITSALVLITIIHPNFTLTKSIQSTEKTQINTDYILDNNIVDFDEDISLKLDRKYGMVPWHEYDHNKEALRYTIVSNSKSKQDVNSDKISFNDSKLFKKNSEQLTDKFKLHTVSERKNNTTTEHLLEQTENVNEIKIHVKNKTKLETVIDETTTQDYSVIPLELISTTQNILISIIESTTEPDLTVIPLSTTIKVPKIEISETVTLPTSTQNSDVFTTDNIETITKTTEKLSDTVTEINRQITENNDVTTDNIDQSTVQNSKEIETITNIEQNTSTVQSEILKSQNITTRDTDTVRSFTEAQDNSTTTYSRFDDSIETDTDVSIFTELDAVEEIDVPEDYYDSKDIVPTTAPRTDALSVIFGLAGTVVESVVESVAERVVPKGLFDLFKRMQRQSEAIEAERLRSREENGGLGQFGRGILKSISTGITKPFSQLMAGVRDIGSLDSDRSFVNSLASGVTSVANVANTVVDAFKDRVQAIYPGTVWCGDGRSATARSSDLGLFFFTDTCCRQHDACKIYIRSGETKYGLTNTGLFTRSHCSCDAKFRECLLRTNSLVSAQIGLTYFNVLGPQCFRRAHPIVRCVRRTRITGQKCEEYELDYTKPRMWQWFDNETF